MYFVFIFYFILQSFICKNSKLAMACAHCNPANIVPFVEPRSELCVPLALQYFYDAQTQQYLYWDSEKQTYAPAPAASDATADQAAAAASSAGPAPTTPPSKEDKEAKEKKDKPKNKSAQQVP